MRAVVTGSSSGIGRAIALEFGAAGADVIVHSRQNHSGAEEVMRSLTQMGRNSHIAMANLAKTDDIKNFCASCWTHWDGCDVWVNNAGADLLTGEAASWDYETKLRTLLDIDVQSTVIASHDIALEMKRRGSGVILNIGWDQADRGMEGISGELFAVAKNAVMGFTRSLAISFAPEVRVNCIAPGWIQTAWGESASEAWQSRVMRETPLKRWGTPGDIAKLARFLCSPDASYITGQIVNCNGGAVR